MLLFGIKSGLLLWGRLAALLMRTTCAVNATDNCRRQCYVDDPAMTIGGDQKRRNVVMIKTVLLWMILGLKLAWIKGHRGRQGEWVGAHYRPWTDSEVPGVIIGISADRAKQLSERCRKLAGMGERVPRAEVRRLAGLGSWMAGLMPQLSAFTRMFWAANHASNEFTIARTQVLAPLQWFTAFAEVAFGPLERRCRRRANHSVPITF